MIERTPVLIAAVMVALTLSGCGDRTAASGGSGGTRLASEEPIDAVPLPLDETPVPPPPVEAKVVAVAAAEPKPEDAAVVALSETTPAAIGPEAATQPPKAIVVPTRDPARTLTRPAPTPAPTAPPAPAQAPEKSSDRPVLTF